MRLVQPGDRVVIMTPNYMQASDSPARSGPTLCRGRCGSAAKATAYDGLSISTDSPHS